MPQPATSNAPAKGSWVPPVTPYPAGMGHYLVQMHPGPQYSSQRFSLIGWVRDQCRLSKGATKSDVIGEWNNDKLGLYTFEGFFNEEIRAYVVGAKVTKDVNSAQGIQVGTDMQSGAPTVGKQPTNKPNPKPVINKELGTKTWYQSFISPSPTNDRWFCPDPQGKNVTIYVVEPKAFWISEVDTEFQGRPCRAVQPPYTGSGQITSPDLHGIFVSHLAAGETEGLAPKANLVTVSPSKGYVEQIVKKYTSWFGSVDLKAASAFCMQECFQAAWKDSYEKNDLVAVINCSWYTLSGEKSQTSILREVIKTINNDLLIICAAGNSQENLDVVAKVPADMEQVLTVGGLDKEGKLWKEGSSGSATGKAVDVYGPATDVEISVGTKVHKDSGTSYACGAASGVAACYLAAWHESVGDWLKPVDLKEKLKKKCMPNGGHPRLTTGFNP